MNPIPNSTRKRRRIHAPGVALVALLSAGVAWSQTSPVAPNNPTLGDFMPKEGDMSMWVLQAIFGNWNGDAQIPMLGAAMQQLNVFALAFGTLMFTWVSIIGTLNSAQDGEVLGRKWSSTWVPLRFIFGTAMMVPLTTGYSTAQHVILWLAMAGSGGGSAVWTAAMDGFVGSQATTALQSPNYQKKLEPLLKDMLTAEICLATLALQDNRPYGITVVPDQPEDGSSFRMKLHYGLQNPPGTQGLNSDAKLCGTVTSLQASKNTSFGKGGASLSSPTGFIGNTNVISGMAASSADESFARMQAAVQAQTNALVAASQGPLRAAAQRIAARSAEANNPGLTDAQFQQDVKTSINQAAGMVVQQSRGAIVAAVESIQSDLQSFIRDSRAAGWMMAGPTFFQMASIRSSMKSILDSIPEYSDGTIFSNANLNDVMRKEMVTDLDAMYARVEKGFRGDSGDIANPGDAMTVWVGQMIAFSPDSDDHALVQIKEKGDVMMIAGQTLAVAMYTANKLGTTLENIPLVGSAVTKVGGIIPGVLGELGKGLLPLIYVIGGVLFFAGLTMALILPTLPFLLSTGAVLGWLMAVFSAVVAAPIWLAGHLNPDGDGFAGQRAAGGYMILLETATRPIFIVLGLIGAFLILDPMCKFTSIAFAATVRSVQANSITGPASIAVLVCLYVVMIWTVVRTSLTLTYDLAQKVYTWIGGQFAGYEKAQEFGQAAQQANGAVARSMVEMKTGVSAVLMRSDGANGSGAPVVQAVRGEKGERGDRGFRGESGRS